MTEHDPHEPDRAPGNSKTLRNVLLVVGSVALALIITVTTVEVIASLNREDTSGTFDITAAINDIEIDTTVADVEISFGAVDSPEVTFAQGSTNLRMDYRVDGDELNIRVERPGWGWWRGLFGGFDLGNGARLTVTLPQEDSGKNIELGVESTAGNVQVDGDFGDTEISTTAGDLWMSGSTHDLTIDTTAGDVRLDGLAVNGELRRDGTAGDTVMDLTVLPDSIDLTSTAGDVTVMLPVGSYRIETDVTAGSVEQNVSSDQNATRVYQFETTAGNITLNER